MTRCRRTVIGDVSIVGRRYTIRAYEE